MGRSRSLVILAGTLLACLCLPPSSLAGTFSWDLPGNFTASAPGANPDHDSYGATPWSYYEGPPGLLTHSHDPSGFTRLLAFATGIRGGLAGWGDSAVADALVGDNPTDAALTDFTDTFPTGQMVMTPPSDRVVAIGWTSPLSQPATLSVTGSIAAANPGTCPSKFNWTLEDQNGNRLGGGGAGGDTIFSTPVVPAQGRVYLVLDSSGIPLTYNPQCATATVSLHITAAGTAPHVTLDSPAHGALISGGQPSFSGSASTAFGASPTVTVRIYAGSGATGAPAQTVTATRRSTGGYTVGPNAQLTDGLYTAQAQQDDLVSPVDAGFSATTTFTVHNAAPTITLKSLGLKPLLTATPTLTGVAGTASGDARSVVVLIYPGSSSNAGPVRYVTGGVAANGGYSVKVSPGLADGRYTAVAGQASPQMVGLSPPMTFRIKVHAPVVSVTRPARGSSATQSALSFSGAAGTALGDSRSVTLLVYAGAQPQGTAVGTVRARVNGRAWTAKLTFAPKLGLYTAVANQGDDAGHTGVSPSDTFLIVSGPTVIGSAVKLSPSGSASVPITCLASAGTVCTGNVLILTAKSLQPFSGGPAGPVLVLFAYVSVPAGKTEVISRPMRADVARVLRTLKSVQVRVSANLTGTPHSTAVRTLRFAR